MVKVTAASVADIEALAPSRQLSLTAENKSPATLTSCGYATAQYAAFARANGMPIDVTKITREHVEAFLVDVIERRSPAAAEAGYRGLRGFFGWREAEGEIARPDGQDEATQDPGAARRRPDDRRPPAAPPGM